MKRIVGFIEFINEIYQVMDTDSQSITALKKELNNLQKWIAEYPRKKTVINNIYMTFQNEKDLISKLKAQKIIANFDIDAKNPQRISNTNVKSIKEIETINPLIKEYIQIAQKRREIKDIETDLQKQKQTIEDRQQASSDNERLAPSFKQDIQNMNDKVTKLERQISDLQSEINKLEQNMNLKFQQMRQDVLIKSKLLTTELNNRKQTQIVNDEQKQVQ
jgi:phage host-nuclease inhibitor protein Gam